MIKPKKLKRGDKVAVVSLSRGVLGEKFAEHQLKIGIENLKALGLVPVFMKNSLKGIDYLRDNPKARAEDLKEAFKDESIKMVLSAIGGIDTHKTLKYLIEDEGFKKLVKNNPKIFMGFSDTSVNHLMFQKFGLVSYYGPAFLTDFADLSGEMSDYTLNYIEKLFTGDAYEIESAKTWYYEREDFSEKSLDTKRRSAEETHGYEVLKGTGVVKGKLFGGCIETLAEGMHIMENAEKYKDFKKYKLIPEAKDFKDKVLILETCERKIEPEKYEKYLQIFKTRGILESVKCVLIGKPQDETYYEEYKEVLKKIFEDIETPLVYNLNFGHAHPRTIIPLGCECEIDLDNKRVRITERICED